MDVTALRGGGSNWNIKVFEQLKGSRYALHEEDIVEVSFPLPEILSALRVHFMRVRVIDADRSRPSARSERLFFTAVGR